MTSQNKKFIEMTDIIGIRLQCRKCGVSLLITDDRIMSVADPASDALYQCPACHTGWTVSQSDPGAPFGTNMGFDKEIKTFLRMLINAREYEKKLGCNLTMEIASDATKE